MPWNHIKGQSRNRVSIGLTGAGLPSGTVRSHEWQSDGICRICDPCMSHCFTIYFRIDCMSAGFKFSGSIYVKWMSNTKSSFVNKCQNMKCVNINSASFLIIYGYRWIPQKTSPMSSRCRMSPRVLRLKNPSIPLSRTNSKFHCSACRDWRRNWPQKHHNLRRKILVLQQAS